ncbi:MAG: hypothetical protein IKS31_00315 [Clostridia bacterium]|nr:hypothetical protein [Clostridia bacterium]
MRRLSLLLVLSLLLSSAALADPLVQLPDLTGAAYWPEGTDETTAAYVYRYTYPQVEGDGQTETTINVYYGNEVDYALAFDVPIRGEELRIPSLQSSTDIRYQIMVNDDMFFTVLVVADSVMDGERHVKVSAQNFSRDTEKPGNVMTLAYLLDILEDSEENDWLRSRQTNRASTVARDLVWAQIEERREEGEVFPEDWDREMLDYEFFPEEDFYCDVEEGLLVFFFQPYLNGPDMEPDSYYTFPLDIEDILDEM